MAEKDELPFLSRWSRRKLETREAEPPAAPAVPAAAPAPVPAALPVAESGAAGPPAAVPPGAAPAELPSVDTLQGVASEYKDFLKPGVDETLKRAALKKLFNDPHFGFANMDKLDIYVDDYSIEDPIPEAMLRSLNQSKSLFLFGEKKDENEEAVQAALPEAGPLPPAAPTSPEPTEEGGTTAAAATPPAELAANQPDPTKPA